MKLFAVVKIIHESMFTAEDCEFVVITSILVVDLIIPTKVQ